MFSLISHPWHLFVVLFFGLLLAVEIGLRAPASVRERR